MMGRGVKEMSDGEPVRHSELSGRERSGGLIQTLLSEAIYLCFRHVEQGGG